MKTLIKKTLLVLMVAFIAVFTLGVSNKIKAESATIDFTTKFATYSDGWSGYAAKTLTKDDLGCSEALNVAFTRVSKQGNTITTMPVVATNNSTEYITVEVANKNIESATFTLKQWTTKTFDSIKIEYFNGATWVEGSDVITTPDVLKSNTFEGNVNKVRVAFTTSTTGNKQVAISSIDLVFKNEEVESEEVKNIRTELNTINAHKALAYKYTVDAVPQNILSEKVDFTTKGYNNAQVITKSYANSFNVIFEKNTNENNVPTYYTTGTAVRCYFGNSFTVSSEFIINKIKFTYGSDDKTNEILPDSGTFSTDTWTGEANSVKFTIEGTSGQRRIASIEVTYSKEETVLVNEYSDVEFRIKCAVDAAIANIAKIDGVDACGVSVSTSEKAKKYAFAELTTIDDKTYIVVSLGDLLNEKSKLDVEFTVKAYVTVDGNDYYSEQATTFSVLDLVKAYAAMEECKEFIQPLVDVLTFMECNFE